MGDPAGVGPEVLLRSLVRLQVPARISIVGDSRWLKRMSQRLRIPVPWGRYEWIDAATVPSSLRPGVVQAAAGRVAFSALNEAVQRLKARKADALVTAPVCKEAIVRSGTPWCGHTEYLSSCFHAPTTMMFVTKGFRVSLVTTHVGIREMVQRLKKAEVVRVLTATRKALLEDFGIRQPRIGLAALNPHGGEGGLFGKEEREILKPALRLFRARGNGSLKSVLGPLPADSLMQAAHKAGKPAHKAGKPAHNSYDAVVALYHDQALIPVKLIGWKQAVNLTLGLPFVRTSPVHGTAFDLAGKSKADASSMRSAIRLAVSLVNRRAQRQSH